MPNIKSAKKRVLVSEKKALENKMFKSAFKTVVKKFEAAVAAGDAETAGAYLSLPGRPGGEDKESGHGRGGGADGRPLRHFPRAGV